MRRFPIIAVLLALLLACTAASAQQSYQKTITFKADHQNPWGYVNGPNGVQTDVGRLDYIRTSKELLKPLAGSFGIQPDGTIDHDFDLIGIFVSVPLIGLDTGAGITLHISNAAIGFEFESIASGGEVSLAYPGSVGLTYPDPKTLFPGDTFTINSTWTPDAASGVMTSSKSNYELRLSALFKARVSIDAVVELLGEDLYRQELIGFGQIQGDNGAEFKKITLLDVNQDILSAGAFLLTSGGHIDAFNSILQGQFIHPPGTDTATEASGSNVILQSHGKDKFLTLTLDVTNIILTVLDLPGIEGHHCVPGLGQALCVDVHVLDLFGQLDFSMEDLLKFQGTPDITVQLSNGQIKTFKAGASLTLTMPSVGAGVQANTLTVAPSFSMANSNTLDHASYLVLDPSIRFQPFALDVCIDIDIASGCLSFKPIDDIVLWSTSIQIDFLSPNPKTFTLPGVSTVATETFDIVGYTYPLPGLASVSPSMLPLNGGAFTLTATGTGYAPSHTNGSGTALGSVIYWDGSPRPTTFVTDTTLTAAISAADAAAEGTHLVTVVNPSPGGGTSASQKVIIDGTGPVITEAASPSTINNVSKPGAVVGVTVSGKITDAGVGVDPSTASFAVVDEYGVAQFQPSGPVAVASDGSYSFVITLQPTRLGSDADGRHYTVTVQAKDKVGNLSSKSTVITVPH